MWHSVLKLWKSTAVETRRQMPRRRNTRLTLLHLEDRTVPSNFNAATVADLIADINAANMAGRSNTITLAAANACTLTARGNWAGGENRLPGIAANVNATIG